ncbi:MAG: mechanosensitive ion channel family protein [Chloroflexi bacterium]|nr:mechanosensitive ion channel family protein [Chloroflexota bacterium]
MHLLSYALATVAAQASHNWIWLALTGAGSAISIYATWRWFPPIFLAAFRKADEIIPGDLSPWGKPSARLAAFAMTCCILTGAGISVAHLLGADTSGPTGFLADAGLAIGAWVRDRFLKILLIVAGAIVLMRVVRKIVPNMVADSLKRRSRADTLASEIAKRQDTLAQVMTGVLKALIILLAAFMVLSEVGVNIAPLLAAAGIAGIALGFGAQTLIKDVLSGLFIIMEDQYRVGDVVVLGDHGGLVEEVGLRRTVLRDLEFVVHVIPNSEVRAVQNMTKEKSRVKIDVPVAYRTNLSHAIKVINGVGEAMRRDPSWGPIMTSPLQVLRIDDFADSAIMIRVLGETLPLRQWDVAGEFRLRIKETFDREGIEIPFPHQTLYWGEGQDPLERVEKGRKQAAAT